MKPPLGLPAVDGTAADAEYGITLDQQLAIACRCPCLRLAGLQATDCREDLFTLASATRLPIRIRVPNSPRCGLNSGIRPEIIVHVAHALLAEQHPFLCCTCIL